MNPDNTKIGAYDIVISDASASDNYTVTYQKGTLTLEKGAAALTAPTAKELSYTGSAQELVNAGAVQGGTLYYMVGYSICGFPGAHLAAPCTVYALKAIRSSYYILSQFIG